MSESYWLKRKKKLDGMLEEEEEKIRARLLDEYQKEAVRLDREIAAFYQKYGVADVIEYRELLLKLDKDDIQLLMEKMDEFANKHPQFAHLLPVRESIYKLDRLEGLKKSIEISQLKTAAATNKLLNKHLSNHAERVSQEIQQMMGFGNTFYIVNEDIFKLVGSKWLDGKTFSDRIWTNNEKLRKSLSRDLTQGLARGDSYDRISKAIREKFVNVSKNDAFRLVYTEGTFVTNQIAKNEFQKYADEYEFHTSQSNVCPICIALEGKIFSFKDAQPGINFAPMHPYCRCDFLIAEPKEWREQEERIRNKMNVDHAIELFRDTNDVEINSPNWSPIQFFRKITRNTKKYEKGLEMTFTEADSGKVNPFYRKNVNDGYANNCQTCVLVYDARRKGYDVEALPKTSKSATALSGNLKLGWNNSTDRTYRFNKKEEIDYIKVLDTHIKPGERHIFTYFYTYLEKEKAYLGHVVILEKDILGKMFAYDPQTNHLYEDENLKTYLSKRIVFDVKIRDKNGKIKKKRKTSKPTIMRVDDLSVNEDMLKEVSIGRR